MNQNTFIKTLNLSEEIKNKLYFQKAIFFKEEKKINIHISAKELLFPEEIYLLLISLKKHNKLKNEDIFNFYLEPKEKTELKNYQLYEYLIFLFKILNPKINNSNYFINFNSETNETELVISNSSTYKSIIEIYDLLLILLSNLNIFKENLTLIHDGSKFKKEILVQQATKEYKQILEVKPKNISPRADYRKLNYGQKRNQRRVYFEGVIFQKDLFRLKNSTYLLNFSLKNGNQYISCNKFLNDILLDKYKKDDYVRVYGNWEENKYRGEFVLKIIDIEKIEKPIKKEKIKNDSIRTELHLHTKMSVMDGVGDVKEYFKKANRLNIRSLGFVDHNSVQSFPEISQISSKFKDIKPIYGVEFDVFDDINNKIVLNERDEDLINGKYIFFDLETTGISPLINEIIEFGAVKQINGQPVEKKQLFIKPSKKIPKHITKLTKITDNDVENAPNIKEALKEIKDWIEDYTLVAHNAMFDFNFLNHNFKKYGLGELKNPIVDTLKISWLINPTLKNHRLGTVARNEGQLYDDSISHRGDYDAIVLQKVYENMLHKLLDKNIRNLNQLNNYVTSFIPKIFTDHFTVLAKNQEGIKDLYNLVSIAHINYFNVKKDLPTLPLSVLLKERKNLLIGSSCSKGKLWEEINYQSNNLEDVFNYYDYIEVFPPSVYQHLVTNNYYTGEEIKKILKEIIKEAKKYNKKVVVTSDAHYVEKEDKEIREVYISNKGLGGKLHPLFNRNLEKQKSPDQYLRNNDELIEEFKFLKDEDLIKKIIFDNPNKISSIIEDNIEPLKKDLYTPKLEGAEEKLIELVKKNLEKTYGKKPHPEIQERFQKELDSIINNGYSIIYYISSLAVKQSINDSFLVGSRGSVGSSLIATLAEITEVNPLRPHYLCTKCKYHYFVDNVSSGYDLEDKECPKCSSKLKGEGQWIPFETFLGFEGNKVPDIDLNFSREYQSIAHSFIKKLLGEDNVFRAGTISTVAQRTAYGYVKKWIEVNNIEDVSNAQINYLTSKVEGTKRTTGQHPGGLIILPQDKDIYDFTPINYPGNDLKAEWLTTHFDFHSIHDNLLKLDFLGHLDPSSIKMLQELTNKDPLNIPKNDKEVISLFENTKALKYKKNYTGEKLGIIGISEFGTKFVRDLVREAKPKSFSDLVRISGLSHGTDVWSGNAKELIDTKIAKLSDVISVRDDIMTFLISKEINNFTSFQIMESIRKGKGLREEWEKLMLEHNVPEWYINSGKKIKYIFPKAHAIAYVLMAYRIAWYKINYPLEYYATFFTKRDTQWDISSLNQGLNGILKFRENFKKISKNDITDRDKIINETYIIVLELYSRGFQISKLSLEKSLGNEWKIDYEAKQLIPPFSILEGIGQSAVEKLIEARGREKFKTLEDFKFRSGLNKTLIAKFIELGLTDNLVKSSPQESGGQALLFDA